MIRSLVSGANASFVAKNGTLKNFFIAISRYLEAEIDFRYFILVEWCFKIMHKKFQVNLIKIEGVYR